MSLRIGTRGSALALWQSEEVKRLIGLIPGAPTVDLVVIKTRGDLQTDIPLWSTEGKGFFTAELDRALLDNEVDLLVHSLKDLATAMTAGTTLAAVLEREDPHDALVSRDGLDFKSLPPGARIGTSSLRRKAFLAKARPDLKQVELRGNVPTRLRKLDDGEYDAIILAAAGLKRLGLGERITQILPTDIFPNAAAQGAIAICARPDDPETLRWLRPLDHMPTRVAVDAERAMLGRLEGGCQVPLGALATVNGAELSLYAAACNLDGRDFVSVTQSGPVSKAVDLGLAAASAFISKGGDAVLAQANARRHAAISGS
ncbi:MAG: hydroxymethylbilane synthase [Rhodospirillaceae bacterium]|nr:hydroxymethylbilane synthase [Rhodospirillaceae bacterium]